MVRVDVSLYNSRRKRLCAEIQSKYPGKEGAVLLIGSFEREGQPFIQDSSFYYFTGIEEPGSMLLMCLNGEATLYVPSFTSKRAQWVEKVLEPEQKSAMAVGVKRVEALGDPVSGYALYPFCDMSAFTNISKVIKEFVDTNLTIFTLAPHNEPSLYIDSRLFILRLAAMFPAVGSAITDISGIVSNIRRAKDIKEVEALHYAIDITHMAQEAAAQSIADGVLESEVQASLEYIMTAAGARPAFPSIVASGKNATILHYGSNRATLRSGSLVIVDIGARIDGYCADITRTYPVSGSFNARQKELYTLVLETQEYIASRAAPGMWLSNAQKPDKSLNHLARAFLKEKGYDHYFPHGIGHFLGLDVHDVGDTREPLQEGDIITIEPGIYIPEEEIGIRIEDNYWLVKNGAVCLSEQIVKQIPDVEKMMQEESDEGYSLQESLDEDDEEIEH